MSHTPTDNNADPQRSGDFNIQLHSLFFDAPGLGILLTDENGTIVGVNKNYCDLSGYSEKELEGQSFTITVHPRIRSREDGQYRLFMNGEKVTEPGRLYQKNRKLRDVMSAGMLVKDGDKKRYKLTLVRDITREKHYEELMKASLAEKNFLLKEIHHRVKNNMAVITGLLALQSDMIEDERLKKIFMESENRIRSIANIHEKLYQTDNFSAIEMEPYIEDMINSVINDLIGSGVSVETDVRAADVWLNINKAVPCGLIIHELLYNAGKHAFSGRKKGRISIYFKYIKDHFELTVKDNGVGIPDNINLTNNSTLGMTLIKGLSSQLEAEINIVRNEGTTFVITFPE